MKQNKTISILGCGWLGMPLATSFLTKGYKVKGSTTTDSKLAELADKNIIPFLINLSDSAAGTNLTTFLEADILIISFPPRLRAGQGAMYLEQIHLLKQAISNSPVEQILFISSTSVYPDLNKTITEAEDLTLSIENNPLLQAEAEITSLKEKTVTILRFAGLVGGARHPGRFFAGKLNVPNPKGPVNLIHLEDCLAIIETIVREAHWNKIFNAAADEHPSRKEFYTAAAKDLNLLPPAFSTSSPADSFKIISNKKLKEELGYAFKKPNPMQFF
ncbi:SDR family oxidoreductase [Adhaeribacter aquaticus]|uniref:SDR family oxidoreductase n=1 Tax=Adhaeribacter aquaticus TaxID=299567 RepID=UPI0004000EBD|nr:SDR family oxidoreductase [Adhaeribacter aquaticus]